MFTDAAIRKRRQKKIRELKSRTSASLLPEKQEQRLERQRFEDAFPRYGGMGTSGKRMPNWTRPSFSSSLSETKIVRWVLAAGIVAFAYVTFHISSFSNERTQSFISEVLERDFNFAGVSAWYEDTFGTSLTFIPAFEPKKIEAEKVKADSWAVPVSSMSSMPPFEEKASVIPSAPGEEVHAVEGGWVTGVKEVDGGTMVVIQHSTDTESTYSVLDNVTVKEKNWVTKGQVIGVTKEDKLYFAIQKNGQYIDPSGVIFID